jgi:predicted NAD-dependent protein-ADP-ribosyltransferase YbiA (DUF1768 family)
MVSSKINKEINYNEVKNVDPEDMGYNSTLYEIEIFDKPIIIALGKQKYTYTSKKIVYYPIYIIYDKKIKAQVGVFEISSERTLNVLDDEGDIDLTKLGDPLLYSFVTPKFIEKISNLKEIKKIESDKPVESVKKLPNELEEIDIIETDENDVMQLKLPKEMISNEKEKAVKITKDGIFEIDIHMKQPITLTEETEEDSFKIKSDFKKSASNKWIENFFKNNYYSIIDNDGAGDCFFYVIRDAFKQIGHNTTVPKLRALLAKELTDDVYQEHRNLYMGFENEVNEYDMELTEMHKINLEYKKRIKKLDNKSEQEKLIVDAKRLHEEYKEKMQKKKETQKLQNEYVGYMKSIDSIDKYRAYIQTSNFWADAWAISTFERLLNVKFIIFSNESFKKGDLDSVLNCGDFNKKLEEMGEFSPNYYIMTTYTGNHYEILSYHHKRIFKFSEIPYDIKILIINKCLEKNSGTYFLIQDFRNLKSKLGLDPELGRSLEEDDETDLYDSSVVLMFHSKSDNTLNPGLGSGEKIQKKKIPDFVTLSKNDDWRRKLDDTWNKGIFEVDKHKWASVEHYILASKYKNGFHDFYLLFSLDSKSDFCEDANLAKIAGDGGKKNGKLLRPKDVKVDPDYHLGRFEKERENAVYAKFSQNEDLKQLLLSTQHALLKKFVRRNTPEPDIILMDVRKRLSSTK